MSGEVKQWRCSCAASSGVCIRPQSLAVRQVQTPERPLLRPVTRVSLRSALGLWAPCHHYFNLHHLTIQLYWRAHHSPLSSFTATIYLPFALISKARHLTLSVKYYPTSKTGDPLLLVTATNKPTTNTWMLYACNCLLIAYGLIRLAVSHFSMRCNLP